MSDDINKTPTDLPEDEAQTPPVDENTDQGADIQEVPETTNEAPAVAEAEETEETTAEEDAEMSDRLERLGGEPAPAISPEEFARLQQSGQIHIDSRGRVRTSRREKTDAGMSLRKRRAWYTA